MSFRNLILNYNPLANKIWLHYTYIPNFHPNFNIKKNMEFSPVEFENLNACQRFFLNIFIVFLIHYCVEAWIKCFNLMISLTSVVCKRCWILVIELDIRIIIKVNKKLSTFDSQIP